MTESAFNRGSPDQDLDALLESDARLRLAIEVSNVGLWDWNIADGEVYFSPEWKSQLGYRDDELPSRFGEWESRLHPDDRTRTLAALNAYLANRKRGSYESEFRLRHKDGSYRWIYTRARVLQDAEDRPLRMLGCHIDITERVVLRQRLDDERRILEQIAQGASVTAVLDSLCKVIERHCSPGASCSLLLLDADGVHVVHGAAPSLPDRFVRAIDGSKIGPAAGSCGTAAYTRRQVVVTDIASDPLWAEYRELALRDGLRACWSTPILAESGEVLGTFAVYYRETRGPTENELGLIDRATHIASIAITRENSVSRLREQLNELTRWQAVMLDREERVQALKREVNDLLVKLGQPGRYSAQ